MNTKQSKQIKRKIFLKPTHCDECGKRIAMHFGGAYTFSEGITFDGCHYPIEANLCARCVKKLKY